MAEVQQTLVPTQTPRKGRWQRWLIFFIGLVAGWITLLGVAYRYGARSSSMHTDPLTGRVKVTKTWIGFSLDDRIVENEVTRWADQNSIPGIYPGQYGWSHVTSSEKEWFSGTCIGCSGSLDIPGRIFRGEIVIDGLTREEVLQQYQADVVASCRQPQSTRTVEFQWSDKGKKRR